MSSIFAACGESGPRGERPAGSPANATCARTSPSRATKTRAQTLLLTRDGILWRVGERTHVKLPAEIGLNFQIFINGVPQQQGLDFQRLGNKLVFQARVAQEGRLG